MFGSLYADKGYISKNLASMLFEDGIHMVTGIRHNMKHVLMSLRDKILLKKRSVIEAMNDQLKIYATQNILGIGALVTL